MSAKTALVIGASRGIGRQIAITLASNDYTVGIAAKTTDDSPDLPGSIHTVAKEIKEANGKAFPLKCDVRKEEDIQTAVQDFLKQCSHNIDVAIYNAGAISWKRVLDTPLKRFDLMHEVNVRGAYCMVQNVLPHMLSKSSGKIILVAPPIYSRFFRGKTAYSVSKVGMSILALGLANELKNTGVSVSTLWPATAIATHVTDVMDIGPDVTRKPTIFADAILKICQDIPENVNGKCLIDEDYLCSKGKTDFAMYRSDPTQEPPRLMPRIFPDLTVEGQDENVMKMSESSKL